MSMEASYECEMILHARIYQCVHMKPGPSKDLQMKVSPKHQFEKWWHSELNPCTSTRLKYVMAVWYIDQAGDEGGGTRYLFCGSTFLNSCAGPLMCVTDVCSSVVLWLSVFTHVTVKDSSCILSLGLTSFKTLVRYSAQVRLSHKLLTMKNTRRCYWMNKPRGNATRKVYLTRKIPYDTVKI